MKVKFNDKGIMYDVLKYEISAGTNRVRLYADDISILNNTSGFDIYDTEGVSVVESFSTCVTIYEINETEGYVEYTRDTKTYYVYYVYNEDGYIKRLLVDSEQGLPNTILVTEGKGKDIVEYKSDLVFVDENGLPNYKAVNEGGVLEVTEVTEEEKAEMLSVISSDEFTSALSNKLTEISVICKQAIIGGVDYAGKHYSYSVVDQSNIKSAVELAAKTGLDVPYHADGEPCELFAPDLITAVYVINETNLTHHTTYNNQLKLYLKTLTSKEEVESVVYGQPLTGEYLDTYTIIMAQAKKIIATYLGVDENTVDQILSNSAAATAMLL